METSRLELVAIYGQLSHTFYLSLLAPDIDYATNISCWLEVIAYRVITPSLRHYWMGGEESDSEITGFLKEGFLAWKWRLPDLMCGGFLT